MLQRHESNTRLSTKLSGTMGIRFRTRLKNGRSLWVSFGSMTGSCSVMRDKVEVARGHHLPPRILEFFARHSFPDYCCEVKWYNIQCEKFLHESDGELKLNAFAFRVNWRYKLFYRKLNIIFDQQDSFIVCFVNARVKMDYSGVKDIAIARIIRIFYFAFLSDTIRRWIINALKHLCRNGSKATTLEHLGIYFALMSLLRRD